jgi:hypothetical protein
MSISFFRQNDGKSDPTLTRINFEEFYSDSRIPSQIRQRSVRRLRSSVALGGGALFTLDGDHAAAMNRQRDAPDGDRHAHHVIASALRRCAPLLPAHRRLVDQAQQRGS